MNLTPSPFMQFFTAGGIPLVGGKLYTYAAGTTTLLATYTDATGTQFNSNPVILNSRGEAAVWLDTAAYKFKLIDSTDVEIWTADNIEGSVGAADLAASTGSSLIGYIAAGSGAVAITVQTKLRESVSVQDFGADPTGAVDATAAINAALAASKCVSFGDAGDTYKISGTLTVQTGSTLIFNGATVTQITTQTPMFDVRSTTGVTISGGNFVGKAESPFTNTASSLAICVRGASATNLSVRNNTFTGFCYSPLMVALAGTNIEFIDNFVTGPGVAVLGAPTAGNRNCTGVTILGNGVTIRGNTIQETGEGIIVGQLSTDVVIDGNIIKNTVVEHGIYCDTGIQRLTISNNLIHNTCGIGMKVQWYNDPVLTQLPSDMTITGNVIQNTGTAAPFISGDGILVYNSAPATAGTLSGVTNAAIAVFTTVAAHGLSSGDVISISGVTGLISVDSRTISGITNANPGVFTTTASHGFQVGNTVVISGVVGTTGVNGTFIINTTPALNTFSISLAGVPVDTTASGAWVSGGTAVVNYAVANTVNDTFVVATTPLVTTFTVTTYQDVQLNTSTWTAYGSGGTVTKAMYGNNVTITGNSIRNIDQDGISLRYVKNAVVADNVIDTCGRNGLYGLYVANVDFLNNNVSNVQYNGVAVFAPLKACRVRSNTLINLGLAGVPTNGGNSGILLDSNGGIDCSYNTVIGEATSTKMLYGIQLASGDKRQYVMDRNIIQRASSAGISLWNDTPNSYALRSLLNNDSGSAVSANSYAGITTAIPGRGSSQRDFFGSAAPVTGTWIQGDKLWVEYPAAGAPMGWTCISSGTPGTWYPFGGMQTANAYTVAGAGLPDRALNTADAVGAVATVLGTLINDLKASGVLQ